jgi:hypothetical protein
MTPALALAYLHELSTDVRAGVVLAADGGLLAGSPALADHARALLAAAPEAAEVEARTPGGTVLATRSDRHAVVVVYGPHVLPALARYDLRLVLGDLDGAAVGPA